MAATTIPADLRTTAPVLALRLAAILGALAALVARAFLRTPRAGIIVPLWTYLARTARRFERLTAHVAAGRLPRKSRPGRSGSRPLRLPTQYAWLIRELRHEAAAYRSQLEALLGEPGLKDLLAAAPRAARLLRPVCRMLALRPEVLAAPAPTPSPPPDPPARVPPPRDAVPRLPDPPCPRLRWPWRAPPTPKPA